MQLGMPAKRRYITCGVNESLLELAAKLREAEVRVNGRTLQAVVPPCNVFPDVSSTVDGGRFQFIARRNHVSENVTASEYINGIHVDVATTCLAEAVARNVYCTDGAPLTVQEDIGTVSLNTHPKKLSLPSRNGPSLWPFLSSMKASVDAEHAKFLEKNQQFYSNYDESTITEDYVEPLSETDFEIIIDSAIDVVLQTQQSRTSKNEPCVSAAVSAPLSMDTDIDVPSPVETDDISTVSNPPAVVSKRYAAAIANPRRFRCGLCPYSTNNRSHVRRHHISVHSDARPFRCYVCGKEFARCENAKVHMVTRHPDVPYDVSRLRNTMFFKPNASLQTPTKRDSIPSASTQSSSMPGSSTSFQLPQDIGTCGISPQWPNDPLATELQRARLERQQAILPWHFPKIEPKLDQSLPVLGRGNTGGHLLEGIPRSMFGAQANTVLNVQSLGLPVLESVTPVKQESSFHGDTKAAGCPVADRHVCLYCQCVCPNAAELANHIAISHSGLSPALHAAPSSNPGYVVLQTAAPIFLFPYGSDSVLQNRSQTGLGYTPILPKLPVHSDESKNLNEALAGQHSSSAAAGTTHRSPQNMPNAKTASIGHLSASNVSLSTPEKVKESPGSSEGKRERKRQLKTFYCSRCPDRAPFRYEKSFEKHLRQHRIDDRSRRAQKIASKVA